MVYGDCPVYGSLGNVDKFLIGAKRVFSRRTNKFVCVGMTHRLAKEYERMG